MADEKIMEVVVEKAPAKRGRKPKKAQVTTVTVKLVKSLAGCIQNQKDCAAALGLKKVGDVKVHPDNAATQGKIRKIAHLVEVVK